MLLPTPTPPQIRSWQRTPLLTQHLYRFTRLLYSLLIIPPQIPLLLIYSLLHLPYHGRSHWSFRYRLTLLIASHLTWALHPGTHPLKDVLSFPARCTIPPLPATQHTCLEVIPPASEDWYTDDALSPHTNTQIGIHKPIQPESCPCFWQWTSTISSPFHHTPPLSHRKIMLYLVSSVVEGHPLLSPIPWRLMPKTLIPIFSVNFRKCVTSKTAFPAALQDAISAFAFLLERGYRAEDISILGDSGGAGIAITFLLYLHKHRFPMPENAILISPVVDLVSKFDGKRKGKGKEEDEREEEERKLMQLDYINNEMCGIASYQYCENRPELRDTLLSPALGNLPHRYTYEGLCRSMVVWGDAEAFGLGIRKFVQNLRRANVKVETVVGKDEVHDFPMYSKADGPEEFYGRVRAFVEGDGEGGYE
ncbi:hypothetical protein SBOR_5321 [Sclerotinia borealis F-4128]|uniref:Alpha/beta hydrolase fold-3 domain-containing protein n=1 Tax=Sclerotinia borealis (strain F-4128) TaxID=1432307 RepID=W9CIJ3_SCLBF|nr:hypothetical protein SBOR_5321 [Sclerotinia borealis F-4128]